MKLELAFSPVRALVRAIEAFRVSPGLLLFGGGLLFLLTALDGFLGFVFGDWSGLRESVIDSPMSVVLSILFGGCCVKLVVQPLRAWILAGYAASVSAVARREPTSFRLLFGAHPWFGVFATSLVSSVLLSVFSLYVLAVSLVATALDTFFMFELDTTFVLSLLISLVFVPLLAWVWIGLLAAPYVAALTGWSTLRSLRTSWRFTKQRRWRMLWFRMATWVASLSGLLACGAGVVATWAVSEGAWLEAVREALAEEEAQRKAATVASSASSIETISE